MISVIPHPPHPCASLHLPTCWSSPLPLTSFKLLWPLQRCSLYPPAWNVLLWINSDEKYAIKFVILTALVGTNQQSVHLPWCLLSPADSWSPHQCLCPCSSLPMQSSKSLDHHLKGGNACSSVINMHLFTWGARTALLPCSRTVIYPPASRAVGRSWMKEGSPNRKSSILPKPRCSCVVLLSIITSFLFSVSISLCLREISWCKKAHLSSTSLEISATAAFTKTSMIEDNWLWKGMHVAMFLFFFLLEVKGWYLKWC